MTFFWYRTKSPGESHRSLSFRSNHISTWLSTMRLQWEQRQKVKALPALMERLSSFLEAGLPLQSALSHMHETAVSRAERSFLQEALVGLDGGIALSDIWRRHVPGLLYLMMVTGETGGSLPQALTAWSEHEETRRKWSSDTLQAVGYPALLMCMTGGLLTFVSIVVVPRFQSMYQVLGLPLPASTHRVQTALMSAPKLLLVLGGVMSCLTFIVWQIRKYRPVLWKYVRSRIPGIGIVRLKRTTVWCTIMHLLTKAGIPLVDALQQLSQRADSKWMRDAASSTLSRVMDGHKLAEAFDGDWDPLMVVLLYWAEETGMMTEAFGRCADYAGRAYKKRVDRLVRAVEPTLVVVMGVVVMATMLSVFLPMYQMISSISAGAAVLR